MTESDRLNRSFVHGSILHGDGKGRLARRAEEALGNAALDPGKDLVDAGFSIDGDGRIRGLFLNFGLFD